VPPALGSGDGGTLGGLRQLDGAEVLAARGQGQAPVFWAALFPTARPVDGLAVAPQPIAHDRESPAKSGNLNRRKSPSQMLVQRPTEAFCVYYLNK